ncbi:WxL protein peptidoglycan domain-containing protein [Streptomyces sp. NPDC059909]|uniref:WxL protein peptidoglycan domain-containing protein n=1 Tax=Streptomyces sp. NPDC059909 TaxID=3346998 RepID=UPI00364FE5F3
MITTSARRIAAVLAACLLAVLPATADAAPAATAPAATAPAATAPAATAVPATRQSDGGQGRTTFGVQPSAARKPDARPNFSYGATPGAVVKDHIAVFNYGNKPLTLRVYAGDAFTTADGGFDLFAADHKPTDVGSWVRLGKNVLSVPRRSHVIVPFTMTVPRTATPGDHTGGIVASLSAVRTDGKGSNVAVDQRVGARIYLRISGELKPQLAVEDLRTTYHGTANPFDAGSATVTYTVRNTGNVRLAARQAVHVRDAFGGEAEVAKVRGIAELLPGAALRITTSADGVLPAVRDTTTVTVDPEPVRGDVRHRILPRVTRTAAFAAVPWALLIVLLVVAVALTLYLVRRRRRRGPRPGRLAEQRRTGAGAGASQGLAASAVSLAVVLLAAGAVVAGTSAEARAAESGGLAVTPARGSDTQPITLTAAGPCPAKTSNVIARVFGAGFPRGGQIVVGNAPLATYPKAPGGGLSIPLIYTMRDYASTAGFTTLRGTYTFTVSCLKGAFDLRSLRDFTGSLRFTAKDAYQDGTRVAAVEGTAPGAGAPGQSGQPVPPSVSGGGTGAGTENAAAGSAAGPAGAGPAAPSGPVAAAAVADDAAPQDSGTSFVAWSAGGFAVALLALLAGVAHWVRGRRARTTAEPGPGG